MDFIANSTTDAVSKALDGLSLRHKAIASNLANVDTPGYQRRVVTFEASLQRAIEQESQRGAKSSQYQPPASNDVELPMRATQAGHFGLGQPQQIQDVQAHMDEVQDWSFRNDKNSVDVETEMVELAKNTGRYSALANMQSRLFRQYKSIITSAGGGG